MFTFYAIVFLPNQAKVYTRNTASSIYESFNLERDAAITLVRGASSLAIMSEMTTVGSL
jgi:hypothetical protein